MHVGITCIVDKHEQIEKEQLRIINNDKLSKPSSKIDKLMELLNNLHINKPNEKCVIFSQWTLMLDLIEIELNKKEEYNYCRLDGKMLDNVNIIKSRWCWIKFSFSK